MENDSEMDFAGMVDFPENDAEDERGEDIGFDDEDNEEDDEYNQYVAENPETQEEYEQMNAETPEEDPEHMHVSLLNAREQEEEQSDLDRMRQRVESRAESYARELQEERRQHGNALSSLSSYASDEEDTSMTGRSRLKRTRVYSSDEEDSVLDAQLAEKKKAADAERRKRLKKTGRLTSFFTNPSEPPRETHPDLSSSDDDDAETNPPTLVPQPQPQPQPPSQDTMVPDATAGAPVPKREILKNLKTEDDYAHTGSKLLLDLTLKSSPRPAQIRDANEVFEFLFPLAIFDTKVGDKEMRAWHRDQKSFKKFQAAYFTAFLASKCHAAGENVSVHIWPVSNQPCDYKSPSCSFKEIFNSQYNTLYFVHIICYERSGLRAFNRYMTYFIKKSSADDESRQRHESNRMPKDPFKCTRFMADAAATPAGNLHSVCASRLPKKKWQSLKGAVFTDAADFAQGLVLLAMEHCGTVIAHPRRHEYAECHVNVILPVCRTLDDGVDDGMQVEPSLIMKEMFSIQNVLTNMLAESHPDLVQTMIENRPEQSDEGELVSATTYVMWPDSHPAYHINATNIRNFCKIFDATGSSSFALSAELVKSKETASTGNQELIVDVADGLDDIYDMLQSITERYEGEEQFSQKNFLLRLVLAKNSDIELPWHKSLKRFMRYIEDHDIPVDRFTPKLCSASTDGSRNLGNVFPESVWQHCQHGGQIGNVHTPMTKLLYVGLAGLLTNPQHSPAGMIFYGMYSAGKSFMFELLQEMFPEGGVEVCAGGSAQSLLQNVSKMIKMMHEEDKNILKDAGEGVNLNKAFFQKGSQVYERNEQTPEGNYRVTRLEYKNDAIFFRATNSGLYKIDPAFLSRNVVCNIGSQNPTKRSKEALAISAQTNVSKRIRDSFNEAFLIKFFFFHYFDMITSYCGEDIENKLYAFIYAKVGELHPALNIANPRTGGFVRNFARVHSLMTTVQACLYNLECFTAGEIADMRAALAGPETQERAQDRKFIDQLEAMSKKKTLTERLGSEAHTHLLCHMCLFDGAASIFFGMSIPFDTTATVSAQEVLMVLKDLCYRGVSNTENQNYIKINYKKAALIEKIIAKMWSDYNRRRDDETIATALQELTLRTVTHAGIESAAILYQDSSVEISKKMLSTTTTKHEQLGFKALRDNHLVHKIYRQDVSNSSSTRWMYDADVKFNLGGSQCSSFIQSLADAFTEDCGETVFYFIPYSCATQQATGMTMTNLKYTNQNVMNFVERFHTILPQASFTFSDTNGIMFTEGTFNMLNTMDTTLGSSINIGEMHIGFSKVAQIVGLFEGENSDDSYLVVEPQKRSQLHFGEINRKTAQMGTAPFEPKESDYKVKNARFIPKNEYASMPPHVRVVIDECQETLDPFVEFKQGENNETLIEREVFESGTLGKKVHSAAVKDIIFGRISKAGQQRAFKAAAVLL